MDVKDILVASEIGWGLAFALPFARWWTKSFVIKAIGLRPNSSVEYSYNDITLSCWSINLLRKAKEVPWPCCMELFFLVREHRHYPIHSYIFVVTSFCYEFKFLFGLGGGGGDGRIVIRSTHQPFFELLAQLAPLQIHGNSFCSYRV